MHPFLINQNRHSVSLHAELKPVPALIERHGDELQTFLIKSLLIAPRPMLIEAGTRDPIFPIVAVQRSVERARQVYGVWGAADQFETDYFEGRHQISGRRAYDFLWEKLVSL